MIPVGAYTVATAGASGLIIKAGWTAWSFFKNTHLIASPIIAITSGTVPSITSLFNAYLYTQFWYSFPTAVKKMVKGWVNVLWKSSWGMLGFMTGGVVGLVQAVHDMVARNPKKRFDEEWLIVHKVDEKYLNRKLNKNEFVFGLTKYSEGDSDEEFGGFVILDKEKEKKLFLEHGTKEDWDDEQELKECTKQIYPSLHDSIVVNYY